MSNNLDLGQHFLVDEQVLQQILFSSELKSDDVVLEVGAGEGVLTQALHEKAKKVYAVEVDAVLAKQLDDKFDNVVVINDNVLNVVDDLLFTKIVANIPYHITEPLLKKLFSRTFDSAVLLVGSNFFNLLDDKKSKWSYIVPLFFSVDVICHVRASSFNPPPRVGSVVLKFVPQKRDFSSFEHMLREFVLQDDKKVKNALLYAFMRVFALTKKESRARVYALHLPPGMYDKNVDYISNEQFLLLIEQLQSL